MKQTVHVLSFWPELVADGDHEKISNACGTMGLIHSLANVSLTAFFRRRAYSNRCIDKRGFYCGEPPR